MTRKFYFYLSLLCFFLCFLLTVSGLSAREEALAADLAPKILRFHVLANSDSEEDQELKLEVKDLLLEKIRDGAAGTGCTDREALKTYIWKESSTLETLAEDFIHKKGYDYRVNVGIGTCRFPVRVYGDLRFPAGMYEAVRVTIGDGAGHNFWCVLYPSLCYTDSVHAVMPEESKETLQALIPEDDFRSLLRTHPGIRLSDGNKEKHASRVSPCYRDSRQVLTQAQTSARCSRKKSEQEASSLPTVKIRFRLAELLSGS